MFLIINTININYYFKKYVTSTKYSHTYYNNTLIHIHTNRDYFTYEYVQHITIIITIIIIILKHLKFYNINFFFQFVGVDACYYNATATLKFPIGYFISSYTFTTYQTTNHLLILLPLRILYPFLNFSLCLF